MPAFRPTLALAATLVLGASALPLGASAQSAPDPLVASLPGAREGYARNGDVRIHYVALGEGPLVVLIHGHPDFWYGWKAQLLALSKTHRVVAIDQRGINLSDQPVGAANYATDLQERDLLAVLEAFGAQAASFVGHDTGANLAWNFAAHYPDRVEKLVALSLPNPDAYRRAIAEDPEQARASALSRSLAQPGAEKALAPAQVLAIAAPAPGDRAAYEAAFARTRPDAFVGFFQANSSTRPGAEGAAPLLVRAPTLVIHGLADPYVLPASFQTTWRFVQAPSALVMIPGAGHFVQRDVAARVNDLLLDWLAAPR